MLCNFLYSEESNCSELPMNLAPRSKILVRRQDDGMFTRNNKFYIRNSKKSPLVQALGLAHGGLEVQRLDVLPVLLKKRDKEVDGQHDVTNQLLVSHLDVTNGTAKTQNLLKLELNHAAELISLGSDLISVTDGSGEFTSLVQTGTQKSRNLLDQSLGGKESIVLLGELLDELLVLVELLQILNRLELHTSSLGLIAVESITENADRHVGTGNVGKLDGSRETLVTLGIVVLKTNLKFDGLDEVTGLFFAASTKSLYSIPDGANANFRLTIGEEQNGN